MEGWRKVEAYVGWVTRASSRQSQSSEAENNEGKKIVHSQDSLAFFSVFSSAFECHRFSVSGFNHSGLKFLSSLLEVKNTDSVLSP